MSKYVLKFRDLDKSSLPLVGGKGANLGELTKAGFCVPQGFCITTEAYKYVTSKRSKLNELIEELENISSNDAEKIKNISESIRKNITSIAIPTILKLTILDEIFEIGNEKSYAIRSSATAEDLPGASFAGQQDTYLNISGEDQILKSIKKCWASLFTERAVLYRIKNNFSHKEVFLSVVVQEMIFSDVSGIMFTADPITGRRKTISINSSFGLGEALVSGIVKSDLFQFYDGKIIKKDISEKKIEIITDENGGVVKREIEIDKQFEQSLTDNQILELASIGSNIERYYGIEQDIEWCLFKGKFYIVQSRSITSLYPLPENISPGLHFYLSIGHLQMMTDAMKPMGFSVFQVISSYAQSLFGAKTPYINIAGSRLYIDVNNLLEYNIFKKELPKVLTVVDESASKILTDFIESHGLQNKKSKGLKFIKIFKLARFFLGELRLFFFGKFDDIFTSLNKSFYEKIDYVNSDFENISQDKKIEKIKGTILKIPSYLYETKVVKYMPLALGSYRLLGIFSEKWLGDKNEVDDIGKAPIGNITTEMGLLIGDLSDEVIKNPKLKYVLESTTDLTFWDDLKLVDGGECFYNLLQNFFQKYGMRCNGEIDITHPRWNEQPTQVGHLILSSSNNKILSQHRVDFLIAREEGKKSGEFLIERIKKTRLGYIKSKIISRLVYIYRSTIGVREHPKYLLINIFNIIKNSILDEAEKLVKSNLLKSKEDIYYFTIDEIDIILKTNKIDEKLLQVRKEKYKQDSILRPPRVFTGDGEILTVKQNKNLPDGVISGTAASSGIIEGIARVIEKLEDADLEKGDILITAYTDPAWTTLFTIAGGVITEVGGLLTHGAVVAREYGIPAVVGVDDATKKILDGSIIRLNGTEGYVQIIK